jgi:manganese/zinc/iron transport system permease protein
MFANLLAPLSDWQPLDTWIVLTAVLAATACAVPGNFLLLLRQSMMGDALSHTVLLGIALAFLATESIALPAVLAGAVVIGVATAWLTEWIQKLGRVEASAALGVVFTSLFALALLLIGAFVEGRQHLDVNCVLLGNLEMVGRLHYQIGSLVVPRAIVVNGATLLLNLLLLALFYKELRISTFDPHLATTQGIPARGMQYGLMAVTAVTVVAAFESVGSILVIAMLVAPAATAKLLCDRLSTMIAASLVVAAAVGVLGHVFAITLPAGIFGSLAALLKSRDPGLARIDSVSTSGMMALTAGMLFVLALLVSPKQGLLSQIVSRARLSLKIACEDLLGVLYRLEEAHYRGDTRSAPRWIQQARGRGWPMTDLAVLLLRLTGKVAAEPGGYRLTEKGRQEAKGLVRSHRLWESYLAKHFQLPPDHLHSAAELAEHYVGESLRGELAAELDHADVDPHGKAIPPEAMGGEKEQPKG